jgi:ribosomal-protein-alanine N-acetyltransferase
MIGTCGFTSLSLENQCGEIGFVLNSKYWGMGIAKEAANLVIKYGFEVLELNRIEARYMSENTQSRRVMEKCGMSYEGTYRSSLFVKGKYRDVGICAILKDEFFKK